MKKFLFLICLILVWFNSCTDEPKGFDGVKERRLSSISYFNDDEEDPHLRLVLSYDIKDRLKSFYGYYEEDSYEFNQQISYKKNEIVVEGECGDLGTGAIVYSIGKNGYAYEAAYYDSEDSLNPQIEFTFEYEDGYLTSITEKEDYYADVTKFKYSDGNLLGSYSSTWDSDDDEVISYTSFLNKTGRPTHEWFGEYFIWDHLAAFYIGILGKPTRNLESCDEAGHRIYYELDSDGYIQSETSNGKKLVYNYYF